MLAWTGSWSEVRVMSGLITVDTPDYDLTIDG